MMRSVCRAFAHVMAISLLAVTALRAQNQTPVGDAGDMLHVAGRNVTVSLLTMGNGEEVWEMFGHTAIRLRDTTTGRDTVFNWGVFDRNQPFFIPHFLKGLMLYQMGGETMERLLLEYRYFNRTVTAQDLDLSDSQKDSLISIIRTNAQPENLQYRYDYFVDNCSTRPRDILDRVLNGQLRFGANQITETSYRFHALRLMQSNMPLVTGVDIGLGEPSDRLITKWQEMFLPKKLHDWVGTRQVRDETGALKPLVKSERVLYQSTRPLESDAPPNLALGLTLLGFIIGGFLLWLGFRGPSLGGAIAFSLWSVICGLLGILLTVLWAFTDHRFAHANENLLLFNPLWLILAFLLPKYLRRDKSPGATRTFTFWLAGLSLLALLAHAVMLSRQVNLGVIGLSLPPALAIAFVVAQRFRVSTD